MSCSLIVDISSGSITAQDILIYRIILPLTAFGYFFDTYRTVHFTSVFYIRRRAHDDPKSVALIFQFVCIELEKREMLNFKVIFVMAKVFSSCYAASISNGIDKLDQNVSDFHGNLWKLGRMFFFGPKLKWLREMNWNFNFSSEIARIVGAALYRSCSWIESKCNVQRINKCDEKCVQYH